MRGAPARRGNFHSALPSDAQPLHFAPTSGERCSRSLPLAPRLPQMLSDALARRRQAVSATVLDVLALPVVALMPAAGPLSMEVAAAQGGRAHGGRETRRAAHWQRLAERHGTRHASWSRHAARLLACLPPAAGVEGEEAVCRSTLLFLQIFLGVLIPLATSCYLWPLPPAPPRPAAPVAAAAAPAARRSAPGRVGHAVQRGAAAVDAWLPWLLGVRPSRVSAIPVLVYICGCCWVLCRMHTGLF